MIGLSEEVLKELPEQIVDYMLMKGIAPVIREIPPPMSSIGHENQDKKVSILLGMKDEA